MPVDAANRLPRAFFERSTTAVARELIGAMLIHSSVEGVVAGRIVETEAYAGSADLASHAARLKNGGVRSMWGPAGIAYVYRSYGIHAMFNIVAKMTGETGAVLIRAVEPVLGVDLMRVRRGDPPNQKLASGPGNLCKAMGITLAHHGLDLIENDRIWLTPGRWPHHIVAGERIGISRSTELPWRFFDAESRHISAHRRGDPLPAGR